jgi:3-methylcrotonyl-CoA carboxylase alpha subunit
MGAAMMARDIGTLLVANRGEIAVRILRTARRMGFRTIAVFSDADEGAAHVACADGAVRIGPAPASESYLDIDSLLAAAVGCGADAIHPGYGFLSENAAFAEACERAGIAFVGPPAEAIRIMGDKGKARALMAKAGVPVLPGYQDADQALRTLEAAADAIGYPVLVKAAGGGGGRGMRVVGRPGALPEAVTSAKREAAAAFGDDRVILERYLPKARHVEVQIFADSTGRVVHLLDRDCSIQRRHQKILEEAPAPRLPEALRLRLRAAAVTCASSVRYAGAGTVEFLVSEDQFFFMEMNTRLQVEHPVTEAITGLDLVEWQIRVSRGEALPAGWDAIEPGGHAIEVRLCAEKPGDDFRPQTGRIGQLHFPPGEAGIRVDTGVRAGDEVSVFYDSLLAKIVAHGADRAVAIRRLKRALSASMISGLATNRQFLADVVAHPAFAACDLDTTFLERFRRDLLGPGARPGHDVIALAAFALLRADEAAASSAAQAGDPLSPWSTTDGWRLGGRASLSLALTWQGEEIPVSVEWCDGGYRLGIEGETHVVRGTVDGEGTLAARIGSVVRHARVATDDGHCTILIEGREHDFAIIDPRKPKGAQPVDAGHLSSSVPGIVIAVPAAVGTDVDQGTVLVVIEAMKMEHSITAPYAGRVQAVNVRAGDHVVAGTELVVLEGVP